MGGSPWKADFGRGVCFVLKKEGVHSSGFVFGLGSWPHFGRLRPGFALTYREPQGRNERDPEARGDPGFGCRWLQPARRRRRGPDPCASEGAPQRPHRPGHRRSSRPCREAHRGGHPPLRSTIPLRTSIAQRTASTTPRSSMMLPLATSTSTSAPSRVRLRQAPAIRKPK